MRRRRQEPTDQWTGMPPGQMVDHNRGRSRRRFVMWTVVILAVLMSTGGTLLFLKHRSDVAAEERQAAAERRDAEELALREAELEAERAAKLEEARATFTTCTDELAPVMDALNIVNARLNVGMSQQEMSGLVGDASVAYSKIDIPALGTGTCLSVGAKLETAFNKYATTVSDWNDCIFDTYCDLDGEVLPAMQTKWSRASALLASAESLLATLDPDDDAYVEVPSDPDGA